MDKNKTPPLTGEDATVVVSQASPRSKFTRAASKYWKFGATTLVAVVLIIGLLAWAPWSVYYCTGSVVTTANQAIRLGDNTSIKSLTRTIKSHRGYQKDATCTYILTQAQIVNGNFTGARQSLKNLESQIAAGQKVDPRLVNSHATVSAIKQELDMLSSLHNGVYSHFVTQP